MGAALKAMNHTTRHCVALHRRLAPERQLLPGSPARAMSPPTIERLSALEESKPLRVGQCRHPKPACLAHDRNPIMTTTLAEARIKHPVYQFPEALKALRDLSNASRGVLPPEIAILVTLRASQINGCSVCVEMHSRELKESGASDDRVYSVAAWREAPYFSPAERAALALTEAGTRLSDRAIPIRDEIWADAAANFDERQLAALTLTIASINAWNRLNVVTRQPSGQSWI
jgi:AhpD family alkylhydroperoxidase